MYAYDMEQRERVETSGGGYSNVAAIGALQAALEEIAPEVVKHNYLCSLRTLEQAHTSSSSGNIPTGGFGGGVGSSSCTWAAPMTCCEPSSV
jgi:hypothetical protein